MNADALTEHDTLEQVFTTGLEKFDCIYDIISARLGKPSYSITFMVAPVIPSVDILQDIYSKLDKLEPILFSQRILIHGVNKQFDSSNMENVQYIGLILGLLKKFTPSLNIYFSGVNLNEECANLIFQGLKLTSLICKVTSPLTTLNIFCSLSGHLVNSVNITVSEIMKKEEDKILCKLINSSRLTSISINETVSENVCITTSRLQRLVDKVLEERGSLSEGFEEISSLPCKSAMKSNIKYN